MSEQLGCAEQDASVKPGKTMRLDTKADPIRFRDPSNPPHRFWAISDESDRFWGHSAHRTWSALGLGLLSSLRIMSGAILLIRFRPTRRSDSPPSPPRIHPNCCLGPEIHLGWP
jgi:hypothetical protein